MPEFQGQTDSVLKVQLQSVLLRAFWGLSEVAAGGRIPIEVLTAYVGDGSEIKVSVKDLEGGPIDTIQGKVFSNYFRAGYAVAKPNKTGGMFFEVEMPAHGLKATSGKVKIGPPIKITDLRILDEEGKEIKEIVRHSVLELSGKVEGPPAATPVSFTLYCREDEHHCKTVATGMSKTKDGKASYIWKRTGGQNESGFKIQSELDKFGTTYTIPDYFFMMACRGVSAESGKLPFNSWSEIDFGAIRGTAVLELPDGSEIRKRIPEDGLLSVDIPKAGRVNVKDIEP